VTHVFPQRKHATYNTKTNTSIYNIQLINLDLKYTMYPLNNDAKDLTKARLKKISAEDLFN
jgi:hypothetical protein